VFRSHLSELHQRDWVREWTVSLQPSRGEALNVAITISPLRDCQAKLIGFRWLLRDITLTKKTQQAILSTNDYSLVQDRPIHFYSKGELIVLRPSDLWLVRRGLVKLSTISETGEEILIGLAGPSIPFSSSMTDLPTYQATALSDEVQLICISFSEVAASPNLSQALFSHIIKRIRQTEALLAISGKRQVKDRLFFLLLWLAQEFGQPIAQGTRLSVRLTHQDLANACCTTRVTITRLLSKLQKQGTVAFDSQHRLILLRDGSQQKCS
jgi:CRP-like cAMP-binding protein